MSTPGPDPKVTVLLSIPFMIIGFLLSRAPYNMTSVPPTKPWADGPLKLITTPQYQTKRTDVFTTGATHMALLRTLMSRYPDGQFSTPG
jgi:hypothetical protein